MKKLFFILILSSVGCMHKDGKTSTEESVGLIRIDIKGNEDQELTSFSNLFEDLKIVPLHNRDSSIIGSVDKVLIRNGQMYLLDKRLSNLYSADGDGNILLKYGNVGQGPGEFKRIDDFDIDDKNDRILILSNDDMAIYSYSIKSSKFIIKEKIGLFGSHFCYINPGKYLIDVDFNVNEKSKDYNLLLIDGHSDVKGRYYEVNPKISNKSYSFAGFLNRSNEEVFFNNAFDDVIYKFSNDSLFEYARINVNSDFIQANKSKHELITSDILMDPLTSFMGEIFFKNKNYIIFNYQSKNREKLAFYNFLNKKVTIVSRRVKDPFIVLAANPVYLDQDNLIVFAVSSDQVEEMRTNGHKLFDLISPQQRRIFSKSDGSVDYYLLLAKIKN